MVEPAGSAVVKAADYGASGWVCLLLLAVVHPDGQHRTAALSFLIPDSVQPWVFNTQRCSSGSTQAPATAEKDPEITRGGQARLWCSPGNGRCWCASHGIDYCDREGGTDGRLIAWI